MTFIDKILKQVALRVPSDTHTLTGARCAYPSGGARISGVTQGTRDTVPSSLHLWGSSWVAMRNLVLYRPLYPSEGKLLSCCPSQGSHAFQAPAKPALVFLLQTSTSAAAAAGKGRCKPAMAIAPTTWCRSVHQAVTLPLCPNGFPPWLDAAHLQLVWVWKSCASEG